MKKIIILFLSVLSFAIPILKPYKIYRFNYYISKIAFNNKYLIIGLENGHILINDFKTNQKKDEIILPKIHDFMGDLISMPIYSLDISKDGKKLLILAQGENAIRKLFIYNIKTKKLNEIFTSKKTFMKASFFDNNNIFLALLSDEIMLYNLNTKKFLYDMQVGNYVFSTYSIYQTKAAIGDESGRIHIIDIKTGKKLTDLSGYNKDKTIGLDFIKNYIINASADKRIAIYNLKTKNIITKTDAKFLPYAAALSFDLKKYAIQYDEHNDILIANIHSKPLFLLKGHKMPLNNIKFISEDKLISYSPSEIIIWKLK